MHVEVQTHEAQGMPMPRRIRLDERAIEVAEVLDQWFGADYRYCKIRGDDGALYILRLDEKRLAWSLTLFRSPKARLSCCRPVRRPLGVNDEPSPSDASVRRPRTECGC
jgi:hypothetical protein